MIQLISNLSIFVLAITAAFQSLYVLLYRRRFHTKDVASTGYQPSIGVVLCLRGVDPSLQDCLRNLAHQNYPDFELHIVMDHDDDPSQKIVKQFASEKSAAKTRIHLHTLKPITEFGSLKCQSLVHVIERLPAGVEVVALVDADVIVDNQWLNKLVQPLTNREIGATTGTRWFTPPDDSAGSWVREIWNTAAIVQMQLYEIAWGGSLAIKMSVFDETNLLSRWRTAFCEDTMLSTELANNDLRVHYVSDLIVDSHESTSLNSTLTWITRQLLTVRLYHPSWFWVFGHALSVAFCIFVIPALATLLLAMGALEHFLLLAAAWLTYQIINAGLLSVIRSPNRELLGDRPLAYPIRFKNYVLALVLSQMIQPVAAVKALVAKRVSWRGVEYQIEEDSSVRLVEYRSFSATDSLPDKSIQ